MLYLWLILLVLLNAIWLMLTFFALPGNWLIVISTCLFAWWRTEDNIFSIYTLLGITALAVGGELVEFFGGVGGAKRKGASWRGSIGALIGAITGAIIGTILIPIPFLGTLIGACIGAGSGALVLELAGGKKMEDSIRYGIGAGLGEFVGIAGKFTIGVIIWFIIAIAAFWP